MHDVCYISSSLECRCQFGTERGGYIVSLNVVLSKQGEETIYNIANEKKGREELKGTYQIRLLRRFYMHFSYELEWKSFNCILFHLSGS